MEGFCHTRDDQGGPETTKRGRSEDRPRLESWCGGAAREGSGVRWPTEERPGDRASLPLVARLALVPAVVEAVHQTRGLLSCRRSLTRSRLFEWSPGRLRRHEHAREHDREPEQTDDGLLDHDSEHEADRPDHRDERAERDSAVTRFARASADLGDEIGIAAVEVAFHLIEEPLLLL